MDGMNHQDQMTGDQVKQGKKHPQAICSHQGDIPDVTMGETQQPIMPNAMPSPHKPKD